MDVHVLPAGPIRTNAYLLVAPERREAVLIDAPEGVWEDVAPILEQTGAKLAGVWLTHGHWDHTQGAAEVVRATGAAVLAHRDDQALIETPEVMEEFLGPEIVVPPVKVDRWVVDGDRLQALGLEFEVRHVPGHCPGNVMFHCSATGLAFVGDALFNGSVGRTDFPGGDFAVLERSIRERIYPLPDATVVHPGHGPSTTVGAEKRGNPYVRAA